MLRRRKKRKKEKVGEKMWKNVEKKRGKMQSKYHRKSRAKSKPTIFFRIISVGLLLSAQTETEIVYVRAKETQRGRG